MISLVLLFFLATQGPLTLEQVKADPNPEHRARAAVDYAVSAERNAETAYAKGDTAQVKTELNEMLEGLRVAKQAFVASGKKPGRSPGPYKYAEVHSRELLMRLSDLQLKMEAEERQEIEPVKAAAQEIHDGWFEGIMGKSK